MMGDLQDKLMSIDELRAFVLSLTKEKLWIAPLRLNQAKNLQNTKFRYHDMIYS